MNMGRKTFMSQSTFNRRMEEQLGEHPHTVFPPTTKIRFVRFKFADVNFQVKFTGWVPDTGTNKDDLEEIITDHKGRVLHALYME
jgi:hypothetical protein